MFIRPTKNKSEQIQGGKNRMAYTGRSLTPALIIGWIRCGGGEALLGSVCSACYGLQSIEPIQCRLIPGRIVIRRQTRLI